VRSVLIINPKGGCGKTTVSTNLAAGLAARGGRVLLLDLDRQQSAVTWLGLRPGHLPRILPLGDGDTGAEANGRSKNDWLVIDSPAGIHGKALSHALKLADKVIVPVQPSVFDMAATAQFLQLLLDEKEVRRSRAQLGVVGVRVDPRTRAAATLEAFLLQFNLPVLSYLRDSQVYPNAAFNGLTVFDLAPSSSERDLAQWETILQWVSSNAASGPRQRVDDQEAEA
jgi:chromosome partitioning protein